MPPATTKNTIDHASVSTYYSQTLKSSTDLKTNACCSESPPPEIRVLLKNVSDDVISKYYGCGLCIPDELEGLTILDLGCGSGRDVYLASQLVGPTGRVIGVDMTEEQLAVARGARGYHAEKFGFDNVEFHRGYLELLEDVDALKPNSVDVIISNCVINLCMDKEAVLKNCYRLLKPGGELYFSDVYANRRVPEELRKDEVLWGECLSGALYWNDFANLAKRCGFLDPRLVEDSKISIGNEAVLEKTSTAGCEFYSATYRLFKIDNLEPACEDYGQAVVYKGTIPKNEGGWALDDHHYMESGKIFLVCGNTWRMLKDTRFEKHFDFLGNWDKHYGIFEGCGTSLPYKSGSEGAAPGGKGGGACC
mmetsp:Transcript_20075/g.24815  ORF Transcript_20075/g.24815 Transcript_20075/m.24815 type:complete len:364 (+) Transcript_20075:132-1223(+)|eukprot:CAMPEP_0172486536 /NCGR_PEP_ID=MMETSP1066-20121228/15153_1 /TAXON_ID=671091 /ORGANISM="Coscinodiscus wailesii, Strain CCMP2513" /LENGTH=363 /DNA_ID=CAMNT_0013252549 /DNA_START=127 /DNA_END=1218 /DNA_ORIENTATION=+